MRKNFFSNFVPVLFLTVITALLQTGSAAAANKEYDLVIGLKDVNFTGKAVKAMTINGNIPGPTLFMNEGDHVKIRVHNRMPVETSIHWHGILLPNKQDGVPYLTTPPIKVGKTYIYEFPVIQSGTYWYHSHTGLQEQRGVYGSIVIYPKKGRIQTDREHVLVFSDWTDENPDEILRTLKRGSDYYSLKKGAVQSLSGVVRAKALQELFQREWMRMPPMDISDVAHDRFLANGQTETVLDANPGETIRLRIINAAASSYFYLQYAGGAMQVVSADGLDVQPVSLNRFLMAIAETYDVLVQIPHKGAFELRATAQDGSGHTSVYIGSGKRIQAPHVPKPNLYKMHGGMNMAHESHADTNAVSGQKMKAAEHKTMQMKTAKQGTRPLPPYKKLRSIQPTILPNGLPWHTITLNLTGDMERYIWSFNNKILTEADLITIRRGQNVRIVFKNETMMHHPMHFHGHFFRVLNGQGNHAPLKHTVDVPPLGKQIIEFYGSEDKDWFLHCHILYHMKAGMARVVHYEGSDIDADVAAARKEPANFLNQDHWYAWGEVSFLSQMTDGSVVISNTRNILSGVWEYGWEEEYEIVLTYDYYFNRFLKAFGGMVITDEDSQGIVGIRYLLPLNVESTLWVDSEGELRIMLEKELQLTDRLSAFGDVEYDTESEWDWVLGLEWILNKQFSLVGKYHSEFGWGGGVSVRF